MYMVLKMIGTLDLLVFVALQLSLLLMGVMVLFFKADILGRLDNIEKSLKEKQ